MCLYYGKCIYRLALLALLAMIYARFRLNPFRKSDRNWFRCVKNESCQRIVRWNSGFQHPIKKKKQHRTAVGVVIIGCVSVLMFYINTAIYNAQQKHFGYHLRPLAISLWIITNTTVATYFQNHTKITKIGSDLFKKWAKITTRHWAADLRSISELWLQSTNAVNRFW